MLDKIRPIDLSLGKMRREKNPKDDKEFIFQFPTGLPQMN
jgi:hypothetical protein